MWPDLKPNSNPSLQNQNKMTKVIADSQWAREQLAEGRRCSAKTDSGKRAVSWHDTNGSNICTSAGQTHDVPERAHCCCPAPLVGGESFQTEEKYITEWWGSSWKLNLALELEKTTHTVCFQSSGLWHASTVSYRIYSGVWSLYKGATEFWRKKKSEQNYLERDHSKGWSP